MIIEAFRKEIEKSKLPGYQPPKLGADYDEGEEAAHHPPKREGERELEA